MRAVLVALPIVLVLGAPSAAVAQVLPSFQDLALRVNLDDQLRVEDRTGVSTTGRLTRLTHDEIAIQTDAGEKRFASDTVREVALRGHALRKGALSGAAVFAVLGAVAVCSHEGSGSCIIMGPLGAAPIGAGVGLAMGALIPRMRTVYRAPEPGAAASRPLVGGGVQASLLENLALRVNLDDQLRVEDRSGVRVTGRLTRLTTDEITMRTSAGEKRFAREDVGQVALRHHPLRIAVLIGAAVGAAGGAVAGCTGPDREECADGPIIAGALGGGVGLAVGALIHRTTIVYPEPAKRTVVAPVVARGVAGVRASLRW